LVATSKTGDVECENFSGYNRYNNNVYVVCEEFGEVPEETCIKCRKNGKESIDGSSSDPDYIV